MFTIDELLEATGGRLIHGEATGTVKGVGIDSRAVGKGELFIAIKGDRFDGHDFIADVEKAGIRCFIVHKPVKVRNDQTCVILVKDTTTALGHVARYHRLRFSIPVIGITGSAGKTTTKEMVACVLKKEFKVLANKGTKNNHIGVPLTLLQLEKKHQAAVIEMGTNQPGDIEWLAHVACPTMAVLTNIGESHLEKLKSLRGVFAEKMHLARAISKDGYVLYNADDEYLKTVPAQKMQGRPVSFAVAAKSDYQARGNRIDPNKGMYFTVHKKTYFLKSFSQEMTYNALVAIACGDLLGVSSRRIQEAVSRFRFSLGRQEVIKKKGLVVINDSYNANPVSMRCAIRTLDAYPAAGRRILVCADMLELGTQSQKLHGEIGECVARSRVDALMAMGDHSRWLMNKAQFSRPQLLVFHFSEVEDLKSYLSVMCQKGDVVLVKGSRRMKMETVVEGLV